MLRRSRGIFISRSLGLYRAHRSCCTELYGTEALKVLRRRGPSSWFAWENCPFIDRRRNTRGSLLHRPILSAVAPVTAPAGTIGISFLSYNIGALTKKRDLFREYVAKLSSNEVSGGVDIIALQETQMLPGTWNMNVPG